MDGKLLCVIKLCVWNVRCEKSGTWDVCPFIIGRVLTTLNSGNHHNIQVVKGPTAKSEIEVVPVLSGIDLTQVTLAPYYHQVGKVVYCNIV